ncbi:MAG TPA: glycosyltransferase family A protein [Elusimicrobiota bacterium]|nr:glycosyltransferase family A protein [Elusimicrobiota bacterium]
MSEAPPFFSVVLPTHNRAAMLRTAVKSVLAQTCRDFECFVLDDGSTDDTPRVFREFSAEPALRLARFEDNRRQHARRNHAIRQARGRFVTFIDSDDIWLPERLEVFKRAIEARPEAGFWFSNAYVLREGRIVGTVFDPRRPIPEGRVPGWWAVGDSFLPYLTTNLAVRRDAFAEYGYFREDMRVLEDTELYARMLKSGLQVGVIREPLAVRRLHAEQITMEHRTAYRESLAALASGGLPESEFPARRRALALAAASFMVKSINPSQARQFLGEELGARRFFAPVYWGSFVPSVLLRAAKAARSSWLRRRYRPESASPAFRETLERIAPLLNQEKIPVR